MPQNVVDVGTPFSPSAGAPKPRIAITRIVGTPRQKSAYAIASARSGKNTGPGRLRITASTSANARISTSAMQKIFTLSRNARAISGIDLQNSSQLKNVVRTSGQPGACVTTTTRTTKKTTVLASAIATPRGPPAP